MLVVHTSGVPMTEKMTLSWSRFGSTVESSSTGERGRHERPGKSAQRSRWSTWDTGGGQLSGVRIAFPGSFTRNMFSLPMSALVLTRVDDHSYSLLSRLRRGWYHKGGNDTCGGQRSRWSTCGTGGKKDGTDTYIYIFLRRNTS